ncbi:hypothetical protein CYK37_09170 [Mesorhizobium loti]|nr:hypothetical protein CYK37_09170 [Mesorhizobium loti]
MHTFAGIALATSRPKPHRTSPARFCFDASGDRSGIYCRFIGAAVTGSYLISTLALSLVK